MLSPGDQFGDFLSQLPVGLFVTVCGSLLLLFAAFAWFSYFKPLRQKRLARKSQPDVTDSSPLPASVVDNPPDEPYDMPDLGTLVDVSALEADTATNETELEHRIPDDKPDVLPEQEIPAEAQAPTPPAEPQPETITPPPSYIDLSSEYLDGKKRVRLHTGQLVTAEEVVTVLRDPRDGRLIVQIEDTAYRTLVDTPDVKKRFVRVMRELSTVVTEPDNADLDDLPVESISPESTTSQPQVEQVEKRTTAPPPPPIDIEGQMPGDLPKYNLDESVKPTSRGIFGTKYEAQPLPELNIAASIEAYLQHKLSYTPEYAGRVLHIHSAPGGGVRIQVDDSFYEAVNEVADPEIREFLSATIREWQERQ